MDLPQVSDISANELVTHSFNKTQTKYLTRCAYKAKLTEPPVHTRTHWASCKLCHTRRDVQCRLILANFEAGSSSIMTGDCKQQHAAVARTMLILKYFLQEICAQTIKAKRMLKMQYGQELSVS